MAKRDLATIEAEIAETKNALANVHGTETEVYARIVGYYRAVRNWNKGKADEFKHRKMFTIDNNEHDSFSTNQMEQDLPFQTTSTSCETENVDSSLHYEFFFRQTCPNCPPVKAFIANLDANGVKIDVDTKDGLALAASKGVFAAPTVIVYNNNQEIARAHNVEELTTIFEQVKATA